MPLPQVSGDKNEEQVLNAIEAYTEHRPEITSRAINLLFDIARIERCNQLLRALKVSPTPGAEGALGLLAIPTWGGLDLAVSPLHPSSSPGYRQSYLPNPNPTLQHPPCPSTGLVQTPWPCPSFCSPTPMSAPSRLRGPVPAPSQSPGPVPA